MRTKSFILIMAVMTVCSLSSCGTKSLYPQDVVKAKDGTKITLTFYTHASIAIEAKGHHIYIDPVGEQIDWAHEPKADLVLITHDHGDHFNAETVTTLRGGTNDFMKLKPGVSADPFDGIQVEAVPAYNISEGHQNFHPKARGDAGYVLTIGGTRIYVAGDTEDNDDVLALQDIDIAFLPVNQPYTMTEEQCIRVVKAIRPTIFYPYHFGGPNGPSNVNALAEALKDITDVRIRPLE